MALTRDFKETVKSRLRADRDYRKTLLQEGLKCLLVGEFKTAQAILRDYVDAAFAR
jgi:hypothetical protein